MYGLRAIQEAHGWTITFLGISVVFSTLAFLSLFVANLNRIFDFVDSVRRNTFERFKSRPKATPKPIAVEQKPQESEKIRLSPHDHEIMGYFELITQKLGEPFSLEEVLQKAQDRGIPRPHSVLYTLIRKGVIIECQGEARGYYCWKKGIDIAIDSEADAT